MKPKYLDILTESKRLQKTSSPKTVFNLGGKGHYENPISDVMSFYCDIRAEHNFGDLMLRSIFNSANIGDAHRYLQIVTPPQREVVTMERKKIDLVVVGTDWVLTIENKIRAKLNNPLDQYVEYITENYPDKKPYYLILSVKAENAPAPWQNILYGDFYRNITKLLHQRFSEIGPNKWYTILHEFLLNIKQIIGDEQMDPKRRAFISQHYEEIHELIAMQGEYIDYLSLEIESIIGNVGIDVSIKIEDWKKRVLAIRIDSAKWHNNNNMVVKVTPVGKLQLLLYDFTLTSDNADELDNYFEKPEINERWTEPELNPGIRGYAFPEAKNINDLNEFIEWAANKFQHKND